VGPAPCCRVPEAAYEARLFPAPWPGLCRAALEAGDGQRAAQVQQQVQVWAARASPRPQALVPRGTEVPCRTPSIGRRAAAARYLWRNPEGRTWERCAPPGRQRHELEPAAAYTPDRAMHVVYTPDRAEHLARTEPSLPLASRDPQLPQPRPCSLFAPSQERDSDAASDKTDAPDAAAACGDPRGEEKLEGWSRGPEELEEIAQHSRATAASARGDENARAKSRLCVFRPPAQRSRTPSAVEVIRGQLREGVDAGGKSPLPQGLTPEGRAQRLRVQVCSAFGPLLESEVARFSLFQPAGGHPTSRSPGHWEGEGPAAATPADRAGPAPAPPASPPRELQRRRGEAAATGGGGTPPHAAFTPPRRPRLEGDALGLEEAPRGGAAGEGGDGGGDTGGDDDDEELLQELAALFSPRDGPVGPAVGRARSGQCRGARQRARSAE